MACFPFYAELGKVCALITYAGNFYCETLLPTPMPHVPEFHFLLNGTLELIALALILQPFLQLVSACSLWDQAQKTQTQDAVLKKALERGPACLVRSSYGDLAVGLTWDQWTKALYFRLLNTAPSLTVSKGEICILNETMTFDLAF